METSYLPALSFSPRLTLACVTSTPLTPHTHLLHELVRKHLCPCLLACRQRPRQQQRQRQGHAGRPDVSQGQRQAQQPLQQRLGADVCWPWCTWPWLITRSSVACDAMWSNVERSGLEQARVCGWAQPAGPDSTRRLKDSEAQRLALTCRCEPPHQAKSGKAQGWQRVAQPARPSLRAHAGFRFRWMGPVCG